MIAGFALCLSALLLGACGGGGSGTSGSGSMIVDAPTSTPRPATTPAPAGTVDVILVMGQSNATGFQKDRSTSYAVDPNVLAWTGTDLVSYAPNVVTGQEWNALAGYWAAELSYIGHYRAAFPSNQLVVLRFTADGSRLGAEGGVDWNTASRGTLFDQARNFVRTAFAAIRARGLTPRVRMVWWQQGEGDMKAALAPLYADNLAALVAALRDPLGDFAVPATMPIVIGRLSSRLLSAPYASMVRDAQTLVAHADIGGEQVLLNDDDLVLESDGLHLTRASQLTLGDRLWSIDRGTYYEP